MGNETVTVLWRALLVMAACWLIGRLVSHIAQRTLGEHLDRYKQQNPIPDDIPSVEIEPADDEPAPDPQAEATVSST
ncbi:MAG: hypothetical protein ACODAQ_00110 [Phycisphaeraceae bacterium]